MIIKAFKKEHLRLMQVQDEQLQDLEALNERDLDVAETLESYTIMNDSFEPMVCFGFVPIWTGRSYAWAFVSQYAGEHFVAITKLIKEVLDVTPVPRMETYVKCDFEAGHRWVKLLGFEQEHPALDHFLPNGDPAALYARFN